MSDVFDGIFGQPKVRVSCVRACAGDRVSHAYLFTGPAGSNKTARRSRSRRPSCARATHVPHARRVRQTRAAASTASPIPTCITLRQKVPRATLSNKFASLSPIPSWLRLLAGIRCISSIGSTRLHVGRERVFENARRAARRRHNHLAWPHPRSRAADYCVALSSCAVSSYSRRARRRAFWPRIRAALFPRPPLLFRRWAAPSRRRLSFYAPRSEACSARKS